MKQIIGALVAVVIAATTLVGGNVAAAAPAPKPTSKTEMTAQAVTRSEIINRAKSWVAQGVPYSQSRYWNDGYRQDCSGFVSMAWKLGQSYTTRSLDQVSHRINKDQLLPGDILLSQGNHVVIFEKWADSSHSSYYGYEQTPPKAVHRKIPYPYFSGSYLPYRYDHLADGTTVYPERAGVAAVSRAFNHLDVFAKDDDGSFLHKNFNGEKWTASWARLGGEFRSNPAAYASGPGRIDLVGVGMDGALWHNVWTSAGGWAGWRDTGGSTIQWTPAITSRGGGGLDVFAVDGDENVVHRYFNGSTWTSWNKLGATATAPPAAVALGSDRMNVFVRDASGTLATRMWTRDNGWYDWIDRGEKIFGGPSVSHRSNQLVDVFARDDADKSLMHSASVNGGSGFGGFADLGGLLTSPPASVSMSGERIDVFGRAANGHLYQRVWSTHNDGWYGWTDLGAIG